MYSCFTYGLTTIAMEVEEMFGLELAFLKQNSMVNNILLLRKAGDIFTVSMYHSKC